MMVTFYCVSATETHVLIHKRINSELARVSRLQQHLKYYHTCRFKGHMESALAKNSGLLSQRPLFQSETFAKRSLSNTNSPLDKHREFSPITLASQSTFKMTVTRKTGISARSSNEARVRK